MTVNVLTRKEIAERLQREGLEVSARTIRYWEQVGWIARAIRVGRYAKHSVAVLDKVRFLAATRPRAVTRMRASRMQVTQEFISPYELILHIRPRPKEKRNIQ